MPKFCEGLCLHEALLSPTNLQSPMYRHVAKSCLQTSRQRVSSIVSARWLSRTVDRVAPLAAWVRTFPSFKVSADISLQHLPHIGYDFVADRDIPVRTSVLSVPKEIWQQYSAKNAKLILQKDFRWLHDKIEHLVYINEPKRTDATVAFENFVHLALYLMHKVNTGASDEYLSFLLKHTFPDNKEAIPHPLLMDLDSQIEAYLPALEVSEPNHVAIRRKFYTDFFITLLSTDADDFLTRNRFVDPDQRDPLEQFLWAMSIIISRSLLSAKDVTATTLVPYLDFTNHSSQAANCVPIIDPITNAFNLVTTRPVQRKESLRSHYGPSLSTNAFLLQYGFSGIDFQAKLQPHVEAAEDSPNSPPILFINQNDNVQILLPVRHKLPLGGASASTAFTTPTKDTIQAAALQVPFPPEAGDRSNDIIEAYGEMHGRLESCTINAKGETADFFVVSMPLLLGLTSPDIALFALLHMQKSLQVAAMTPNSEGIDVEYTSEDVHALLHTIGSAATNTSPPRVLRTFKWQIAPRIIDKEGIEAAVRHFENIVWEKLEDDAPADEVWRRSCAFYHGTQLTILLRLFEVATDFAQFKLDREKEQ